MTSFKAKSGVSVVSVIIPQAHMHNYLTQTLSNWPYNAIQFDCRGTMVREHWFQAFLPTMNPECEYLQFLVNEDDLDAFVQFSVETNNLHIPGAGAIFATRCSHFSTNAVTKLVQAEDNNIRAAQTAKEVKLKHNLYAIFALIQTGRTDNAIKAAMQAGSHGPIVYFVEGRGIRDRIGWLKITKKPYEEVVMVLVEDIDRERVKEALGSAGRVNTLGGGILFEIPIDQGLVNLPTSISNKSRMASNEQITQAIDQLMGNTNWRDTRTLTSLLEKQQTPEQKQDKNTSTSLTALVPRKYVEDFLDYILSIGIPGANVIYTKLFSGDDAENPKHLSIHHELAQIRMVLPKEKCAGYRRQLQAHVEECEYKNVTFFGLDVKGVARYQMKVKEPQKSNAVYRGITTDIEP